MKPLHIQYQLKGILNIILDNLSSYMKSKQSTT